MDAAKLSRQQTLPFPPCRADARPQMPFARKLVPNQWLLGLFDVERFEQIAEHLRHETMEGLDENNLHRFHMRLPRTSRN